MGEGLKLVNEIFKRAQEQHDIPQEFYAGVFATMLVLSNPVNADLWKRMVEYCREEQPYDPEQYYNERAEQSP